jgi:hypothetical protein
MRVLLVIEFLFLFVVLPLAYRLSPVRFPGLPLLWVVAGYALWRLLTDPHFSRDRLWKFAALPAHLPAMLSIFAAIALGLWIAVRHFAPHLQWNLPREHPGFWAIVMVAYPVLSVYPQGLLYRAFFFARYAPIFPARWEMILASAAAFAFLHIIFHNSIAVGLTFAGGILFALRYAQTGSLAASSFEHALYGCWLFTVGLGPYFYHGTISSVGTALSR